MKRHEETGDKGGDADVEPQKRPTLHNLCSEKNLSGLLVTDTGIKESTGLTMVESGRRV